MTIQIKPGDIVEYRGERVRVMLMTNLESSPQVKLSHFDWYGAIPIDDVKLVESIPEPTIKDYDDVTIQPIPTAEKNNYGVGWGAAMDKLANVGTTHQITHVHYSNRFGWIGRIGNYTFQLYHSVPANHFDMI